MRQKDIIDILRNMDKSGILSERVSEAIRAANSLIAWYEPVKPIKPEHGEYWWLCGVCRRPIDNRFSYCPICGKRIHWDALTKKREEDDEG